MLLVLRKYCFIELGLPTCDTLIHNSRILFNNLW